MPKYLLKYCNDKYNINMIDFKKDITKIKINKNTLIIGEIKSSDLETSNKETKNMKVAFKKMIYAFLYYNFISENINIIECKNKDAY